MAELEGMAGRLCARRMTAEQKAELLRTHKSCEAASRKKSPDDYYDRNEAFHQAIFAGSNNLFLAEQATALRRRLQPYRRIQLRVPKRVHDSLDEHEAIVDAILEGESEHVGESPGSTLVSSSARALASPKSNTLTSPSAITVGSFSTRCLRATRGLTEKFVYVRK